MTRITAGARINADSADHVPRIAAATRMTRIGGSRGSTLILRITGVTPVDADHGNQRGIYADHGDNADWHRSRRGRGLTRIPRIAAATRIYETHVKRTGLLEDLISWEDGVYGTSESVSPEVRERAIRLVMEQRPEL